MKKIILLVSLMVCSVENIYACNICGCASGANYNGILPQYAKNIIALRNRFRGFEQTVFTNGNADVSLYQYNTVELWGRVYLKKRVQFFYTLPYTFNTVSSDNATNASIKGIGDMSFQLNYNLINTTFDTSRMRQLNHNVLIGGGVKLPTGKYQQRNEAGQMYQTNFQTGSGGYSFIATVIYTARVKKAGVNADINYMYNTANELDYAFGNQVTSSITFFAWLKKGSVTILPNTGLFYEYLKRDISNGYYNPLSGGYAVNYNLGADIYYKRLYAGTTFMVPVMQQIGSDKITYTAKYMINIGYMF